MHRKREGRQSKGNQIFEVHLKNVDIANATYFYCSLK